MFTIPLETNHTLPEISLEQFEDINEVELNCIFAESSSDREMDFDIEAEIEKLYYNGQYSQLIRTRSDYKLKLDMLNAMERFNIPRKLT